ncbi:ketopantoate reductase family protein, partial [Methylobacterium nigriterrae]|uniref:ketopantoate reductase family protein n=1 Tax=Methylobacterium nigriterrae TaxID=3127512 RepID=UPI003013C684
LTYGQLYDEPLLKATAVAAVAEAMEIAHAMHIRLSITQAEQAWDMASAGLPYGFKASMLQSLEKGSVTEVDFVNGSVVRYGESTGIAT